MKKTSFVIAILASALLAGACGGKKAAPVTPPAGGSDMGSAAGSGEATAPAGGSGSAM
jgi:hypothetical protein